MNVLKCLLRITSVAGVLLLGACATSPGSAPAANGTATDDSLVLQSSRELKGPGPSPSKPETAPRNGAALRPIDTLALPSRSVVSLAPPTDLWERIRRSYAMPNLDTDLVHDREQWYSSRPEYIFRMTERSKKYLFHVVEELELRNMPTELALLPFIESAFNPQAVSSAKAAGMWQFMPATGKYFELKQNAFRDDRRDVLASTRAALDYMQKLYGMFGDWHLALAAYNWGEGSVARAIAKNKKAGLPTGYSDINMPMETRMYVPKLQAIKNIVSDPARFSSALPLIENHPYFQTVNIRRDMDLNLAAKLAEVDLADFKALNPSLSLPVILAAGTPQILLPWDNAAIFQTNLDAYGGARLASWSAWVAPTTMRPADAAKRVGMSEAELRSVNRIPPRVVIRAGSTLLIPRKDHMVDVTEKLADTGQLTLAPEVALRRTTVRAGKRDTVASVAKKYHVTSNSVAEWNKVSASASFKSGQQVVLYLPHKPSTKKTATSKRSSGGKATNSKAASSKPAASKARSRSKVTSKR